MKSKNKNGLASSNQKDGWLKKIQAKRKNNQALGQRDALLNAIAQSAQKLLSAQDWRTEINDLLCLLGKATQASHVYIFENHLDENKKLVTSQKYEWVGEGQNIEIANQEFQNVPLQEDGASNWYATISAGKPFYNTTKLFASEWKNSKSRSEIKTLLDVPIFVNNTWWGVIGFDDCKREMAWSQADIDAMQAAAGMLGAAIKRQQSDAALRISEEKFHTTFHHTFIPMVIGRISDKVILDVNEAFSNEMGYTREEVINHSADELRLWVNAEEHIQHSRLRQKQGYTREFKAKFRKQSGETGVMLVSTAPLTVNEEACVLYTLYNITKIEDLLSELRDKNNELERFTYTVSHDLKAPLITIGGFVGYLEKDILAGNAEKARQDVQRVMDAVYKMQTLLNELLELSRLGRVVNKKENVNIGEIAEEAVRLLQGRLISSNVKVKIEKDLPFIQGDHARLLQVVQNLIDNSAKFMGDQPNPLIEIGIKTRDLHPVFYIRDNGMGINEEYHDRIFGLFDKLNAKTDGTGIGLALVKRIIELHNGKIWVESDGKNKGSTFLFTLSDAARH
ncbi:MAG: PAS domain S-box protein [Anaerolineales bacterium]|nr:PAS domain S-box protein [Anaerolineales bacterium]